MSDASMGPGAGALPVVPSDAMPTRCVLAASATTGELFDGYGVGVVVGDGLVFVASMDTMPAAGVEAARTGEVLDVGGADAVRIVTLDAAQATRVVTASSTMGKVSDVAASGIEDGDGGVGVVVMEAVRATKAREGVSARRRRGRR